MREIIFDTETTGLDKNEDRIIEIGCVEMEDRFLTGRTFHQFINPQGRLISAEARAIHGISNEQLLDKPMFNDIVDDFLSFTDGAKLVAHNAMFDLGFINAELDRIGQQLFSVDRIIDTLALARRKHPLAANSLDALCKRYGIDNSHRTLHGALLDSEILADVYIELIGGKQGAFGFSGVHEIIQEVVRVDDNRPRLSARPHPLPSRVTEQDLMDHDAFVTLLGDNALWLKYR